MVSISGLEQAFQHHAERVPDKCLGIVQPQVGVRPFLIKVILFLSPDSLNPGQLAMLILMPCLVSFTYFFILQVGKNLKCILKQQEATLMFGRQFPLFSLIVLEYLKHAVQCFGLYKFRKCTERVLGISLEILVYYIINF